MDNQKSIIIICFFSVIILMLVGTYALFTTDVSSSARALSAGTAKFEISLDVLPIYHSNQLIPMDDELAVTGFNNHCVDINNFDVCQAYTIHLTNSSGTGQDERLSGFINFSLTNLVNLSYMVLDSNNDIYVNPTKVTNSTDLPLGDYVNIKDGESADLTLIIWLSNISDADQTNADADGTFSASVTYLGVTGSNMSTSITGVIN